MAELPGQIQQGLATLELQGSALAPQDDARRRSSNTSFSIASHSLPDFSLFPVLPQRTPNVPPLDAEKEAVLESSRATVIASSDPEVQLMWANDALTYVDISAEHDRRMSYLFGTRPSTPTKELQMRADAINIVEFLAGQRHPRAEFMKGMWLEFGKFGYREDKPEAFRTYKRAAEKGYARAEYRMGMLFESTHQPLEALQRYRAGEKAGDSAACYRLGMTHLLGQLGQPQDFPVAVQLIKHAADHADENAPQGAYVYGMLLANELPQITVPAIILQPDSAAARIHLERSAFLGFSKAQAKMGSAYELCALGCPFDPALSLHYNRLAARQGDADAEMSISKWFLCGATGVFSKSESMAYHFAERAASDGLDTAEFAMGYFNEIGIACPVNIDLALQWYRKAAEKGSKDAAARIEALTVSRQNTLSKKDHEKNAIERIRSTHASKRGNRPERLVNTIQNLPPVKDAPSNQGHVRKLSAAPVGPLVESSRPASTQTLPPRSSSITPYPLDDRPATVAPYPLGDDLRPTSKSFDPVAVYTNATQRPPSMGIVGHTGPRRHSGAPPGAVQPMPAAVQRVTGHRQPSETPPARPPKELLHPQTEVRPGDHADLRRATRTPDFGARPGPKTPDRTPPRAQPQRGSPGQSLPVTGAADGRRPSGTGSPLPPPGASRPGVASRPAAAATSRPPGKGPQTFEQMGIPAGKNESDCVSFQDFISGSAVRVDMADLFPDNHVDTPHVPVMKTERSITCTDEQIPPYSHLLLRHHLNACA